MIGTVDLLMGCLAEVPGLSWISKKIGNVEISYSQVFSKAG